MAVMTLKFRCEDCAKEYRSRSSLKRWFTGEEETSPEHLKLCGHCWEERRCRQELENYACLAEACRKANTRADVFKDALHGQYNVENNLKAKLAEEKAQRDEAREANRQLREEIARLMGEVNS